MDCRKLNEVFNLEGPDFMEEDDSCYIPFSEDSTWNDWVLFQKGHTINKGRPTSALQKEKARENALKRNANQKGGNNRNAGTWQITFKDGRIIVIKALQRWAVDNGYTTSGVKNLAYKKWKQYRDIQSIDRLLVTSKVS